MISFILTFPNAGSWDGKFSGSKNLYAIVKKCSEDVENELNEKSFYYNFGDGWTAKIQVIKINSKDSSKIKKSSKGFFGYDWMIESILKHGKIIIEK